jgi:hypothetical protein
MIPDEMLKQMYSNSPSLFPADQAVGATKIGPSETAQAQMSEYERSQSPEALRAYFPNSPGLFEPPVVDHSQDAALRAMYPSMFKDAAPPPRDPPPPPVQDTPPPKAAAELQLEAPEGIDGTSEAFAGFRKVAGEIGLDAPRATKVLEWYRGQQQAQIAEWEKTAREDQEFGGAAYEQNRSFAIAAAEELGGPGAAQTLRQMKAIHPTWFRLLARIGRALQPSLFSAER